jgi:adenylate kinase
MRWQAILLIGPTGSGKTPLGRLLEAKGLGGRRCLHFDFGEALRAAVAEQTRSFTGGERDFILALLRNGALLDDAHFSIARKLLIDYLAKWKADGDTFIVLNGLPRHIGQARAMEEMVDMRALISLECESEIMWERIRANTGGDRGERSDDTFENVKQRLEVFRQMTVPLLEYYGARGVSIFRMSVGVKTMPEETYQEVEAQWSHIMAQSVFGKIGRDFK